MGNSINVNVPGSKFKRSEVSGEEGSIAKAVRLDMGIYEINSQITVIGGMSVHDAEFGEGSHDQIKDACISVARVVLNQTGKVELAVSAYEKLLYEVADTIRGGE